MVRLMWFGPGSAVFAVPTKGRLCQGKTGCWHGRSNDFNELIPDLGETGVFVPKLFRGRVWAYGLSLWALYILSLNYIN